MAYAAFDVDTMAPRAVSEEVGETEAEAGNEEVDSGSAYGRASAPPVSASPRRNLRKRFIRAEMMLLPLC